MKRLRMACKMPVEGAPVDVDDPALENRAVEIAYALLKTENYANAVEAFKGFLKQYPNSVHIPAATHWLGDAQFALKDYKAALLTYRELLKIQPESSKTPDVLFNVAICQQELKAVNQSRATLKQLITNYPASAAAAKAKVLIAAPK